MNENTIEISDFDVTQTEQALLDGRASHATALIAGLAPYPPSEYEYRNEVIDCGESSQATCACGHPIRYLFPIYHPFGRVAQVGSTCIEHYAQLSPETGAVMLAVQAKLQAEINAAKVAAKRAQSDAENAALWAEYCAARDGAICRFRSMRERGFRASRELWYFAEGWHENYRVSTMPDYVRAGDLRKWLTKAISRIQSLPRE